MDRSIFPLSFAGEQLLWWTRGSRSSLSICLERDMKVPRGLSILPIWAMRASLFPVIIVLFNSKVEATVFGFSRLVIRSQVAPISQFSAEMEAQSPGTPGVRIVHHEDLNKKILIALVVASTFLVGILVIILLFWVYRHKNSKNFDKKSTVNSDVARGHQISSVTDKSSHSAITGKKGSVAAFEYQVLEVATNNFQDSNLLGESDSGRLYTAYINEKSFAIIKKLYADGQDTERQFEVEINWLSRIHHQNVISLLGCCAHGEMKFLVYEMMQNGTLETQLHGPSNGLALTWQIRMKIAVDIARGLEFLHEHCIPPVLHRNLKSSSILLDANFNAKISDFGLAATSGTQPRNDVKIIGTMGNLAPEYFLEGKLTDKSDVYSFGIILLELLMGRNPAEKISTAQSQSLVTWATPQLTDRSKLPNIVDPAIKDSMDQKHLYQVAAVAVLCIQPEPSYRPLITDVLHSLIPLVPAELGGSLRVSEPANRSPT
ncbi:hypothetical protein SAY86_026860 [Trapa natans]|uniref:Protein kinase domain-containing protein n=1 Tax=Trapa natans TaxID=22666 RepID=A0AAN7QI78_TRANT|nr:hypothetical protein SAY86_026860 [Trapa natans]